MTERLFPTNPRRWAKGIYWTDPWMLVDGCSKARPLMECRNCWAEAWAMRMASTGMGRERFEGLVSDHGWTGRVSFRSDRLYTPVRKKKPRTLAVWTDLFHSHILGTDVASAFRVMANTPRHVYLVLTKRAMNMRLITTRLDGELYGGIPPNVGIGVTIGCQNPATIDGVWRLADTPAGFRFLSMEPLLERVTIPTGLLEHIDWITVGCESLGPRPGRPTDPIWIQHVIDQARGAGVPVHVKQMAWNGKLSKNIGFWPHVFQRREVPRGFTL